MSANVSPDDCKTPDTAESPTYSFEQAIDGLRHGRRAALRPLMPDDIDLLYRVELSEELGVRWRFRGATPPPSDVASAPWQNTLATFIIERKPVQIPVGLVSIFDANMVAQRASFSLVAFPGCQRTPAVIDGALIAINYAFSVWPFRKLYAEVMEFNLDQVASLSRHLFDEEARLSEWEFFDGRWWDLVYLSLNRDSWVIKRDRLLSRIRE